VTIGGTNFTGTNAVTFGSNAAASFTVNSDTQITATSPAGTGTVDITVTTLSGTSETSSSDHFSYAASTDSQNIRALQIALAPIVADTSGHAITSAIDSSIGDAFGNGGNPITFGTNGVTVNFAVEPRSEIATRAEEAFAALGYAGNINKAANYKMQPNFEREWSAWANIRGTGAKLNDTNGTANDIKGSQLNLTAGLGRKLNADTLVGIVVGYEYFKYDVASLGGSLKGDGETIGGYFTRRFGGNLRFDAALAWTNLNCTATAGAATGSFKGSRWLASTGLTGNHKFGVYMLEPSAKLYVLWEREKEWTDSLGTSQAARNFSAGRTALGSKVARALAVSGGWTISPYVGLYGDWRFSADDALPTGTPVANIGKGWSGRVTTGLSASAKSGCTISLGGEYGGLGANFKIWSGNIRATMPL
jgi:outer membrane autotransporter protein